MSDSGKAVFLSYASQDADAARRIADALRAAGVEVWFDQSELVGGDAWDAKIRGQISSCALFVPLISANTQARLEGYFRREWKQAAARTHDMADEKAFLMPVVIDGTRDAEAKVPAEFRAVQWTQLPGGETPEKFCERVKMLLGGGPSSRETAPSAPASREFGPPGKKPSRRWFGPALAGAVVVAALALWQPGEKTTVSPDAAKPVESAKPAAPLTEAQQLVAKVRAILEQSDEMNRETYTLAEELLKKAEALDPTEASAWALHASLSASLEWFGFDTSPPRLEAMRVQASRALTLAPNSDEAQLAAARVRTELDQNQADSLRELQAIVKRSPDNWQAWRVLGRCLRMQGDADAALAAIRRALQLSSNDPVMVSDLVNHLTNVGLFAESERAIREQPAGRTPVRLLAHDLFIELYWRGNPSGATVKAASWPTWFLVEDRGAGHAALAALWNRDPAQALRILARYPRDYLTDYLYTGPRAVLTAWANEQAGNEDAALADWRIARQVTERILVELPDNHEALYWKAWALARLGDRPGATAILRLLEQRPEKGNGMFFFGGLAGLKAALGDIEDAVDQLAKIRPNIPLNIKPVTKAFLALNPVFDPLRDNARFKALVDAAPGPAEKKEAVAAGTAPADKSVAVLAFANLSSDKEQEYFSDGISEELLTVLQKIPGLHVAARTSAFSFKGKNAIAQEIGTRLGVAHLVEGSVQKSGSRVKVTARLSRVATGEELWSRSYTRELKDAFALQEELATAIVGELRGQLGGVAAAAAVRAAVRGGTTDAEAHQLFLQGRHFQGQFSMDNLNKAVGFLGRAVELDPKFALAWAAMSRAHAMHAGWTDRMTQQAFKAELALARRAADRALELEPDLPEALNARFEVQFNYDFDFKGGAALMRRALALAPSDPVMLGAASRVAGLFGDRVRAVELARQAVALDPVNAEVRVYLALALLQVGRWAEARSEFARVAELSPATPWAFAGAGLAYLYEGKYAEALATLEHEQTEFARQLVAAIALWGQKKTAEADALLAQTIKVNGDVGAYQIAEIHGFRGDKDQAFAWLERARRQRDAGLVVFTNDPFFDSLRPDPRWAAFQRSMGLTPDQIK